MGSSSLGEFRLQCSKYRSLRHLSQGADFSTTILARNQCVRRGPGVEAEIVTATGGASKFMLHSAHN